MLALHGENEHESRYVTLSSSRKLRFCEKFPWREFAPPPSRVTYQAWRFILLKAFLAGHVNGCPEYDGYHSGMRYHLGIKLSDTRKKVEDSFLLRSPALKSVREGFQEDRASFLLCRRTELRCLSDAFHLPIHDYQTKKSSNSRSLHHYLVFAYLLPASRCTTSATYMIVNVLNKWEELRNLP